MKRTRTIVTLALALAMGAAHAEMVWKWTGADGKAVYGQTPPKGVKAEQVNIQTNKGAFLGAPGQAAAPAAAPAADTIKRAAAANANNVQFIAGQGTVVQDASRVPGVRKYAKGEKPYCPPFLEPCKTKQQKGDYPVTQETESELPKPDGKGGYNR